MTKLIRQEKTKATYGKAGSSRATPFSILARSTLKKSVNVYINKKISNQSPNPIFDPPTPAKLRTYTQSQPITYLSLTQCLISHIHPCFQRRLSLGYLDIFLQKAKGICQIFIGESRVRTYIVSFRTRKTHDTRLTPGSRWARRTRTATFSLTSLGRKTATLELKKHVTEV